ncbi:MAG: single-stranded DNA-binding protein [Oscillospiraceae bacterium]|jgi:single-strand DNA-binding protein|nr:single-stranded DNA-binding protein [Oscillospiraceae bacterium]
MFNKIIIMGRITHDLELRTTPNGGIPVLSFSIAVDRFPSKDKQKETDFFKATAWRQTAEFIYKYFRKGALILVEGSCQIREWIDQQGVKQKSVEVQVAQASFTGEKLNSPNYGGGEGGGGGYDGGSGGGSGGYNSYGGGGGYNPPSQNSYGGGGGYNPPSYGNNSGYNPPSQGGYNAPKSGGYGGGYNPPVGNAPYQAPSNNYGGNAYNAPVNGTVTGGVGERRINSALQSEPANDFASADVPKNIPITVLHPEPQSSDNTPAPEPKAATPFSADLLEKADGDDDLPF